METPVISFGVRRLTMRLGMVTGSVLSCVITVCSPMFEISRNSSFFSFNMCPQRVSTISDACASFTRPMIRPRLYNVSVANQ